MDLQQPFPQPLWGPLAVFLVGHKGRYAHAHVVSVVGTPAFEKTRRRYGDSVGAIVAMAVCKARFVKVRQIGRPFRVLVIGVQRGIAKHLRHGSRRHVRRTIARTPMGIPELGVITENVWQRCEGNFLTTGTSGDMHHGLEKMHATVLCAQRRLFGGRTHNVHHKRRFLNASQQKRCRDHTRMCGVSCGDILAVIQQKHVRVMGELFQNIPTTHQVLTQLGRHVVVRQGRAGEDDGCRLKWDIGTAWKRPSLKLPSLALQNCKKQGRGHTL